MNEYAFTLKFALPETADGMDVLTGRLYEAGCDDALIGTGQPGRLALNFDRQATSAVDAVNSAMADVQRAVPGTELIEAGPDLVGLTDISELMGCSRQNMRKLMLAHRDTFPLPVHESRASLWHLVDILQWFKNNQNKDIDDGRLELTNVTMHLNIARANRHLDPALTQRLKGMTGPTTAHQGK